MDVATLGMRVERTQVEQGAQALRDFTQTAAKAERAVGGLVDQFGRIITPTTTATYKVSEITRDVGRLHNTSLTTTRGIGQLRGAFQALAVQAVGVPGPLGRIMSILLQMSTGGLVATAVLGFVGALALAWKVFADRAKEAREELERIRQTADQLQRTRLQRAEGLIGQVFGGPSLAGELTGEMTTLGWALRDAITDGDTQRVMELQVAIRGLADALAELQRREAGEWVDRFLDQLDAAQVQRVRVMTAELRFLRAEMIDIGGRLTTQHAMMVLRESGRLQTLGLTPVRVREPAIPELPPPSFWQKNRGQFIGAGLNIASNIGRDIGGPLGGAIAGAAGGFAFGGPVGAAIGGFTGLISGILGAGAAARRAMEQFRQFQEGVDRQLAAARIGITGSPLEQALAANTEFFQRMRDEIDKNFMALKNNQRNKVAGEVNAQLAETVRLEQLKADQLREAHTQERGRLRQDLAIRQMRAEGFLHEADALAFALAQQREYQDAQKAGADVAALAALALAQAAEAEQRRLDVVREATRTQEDLAVRLMRAQGFGVEAETMAFALTQQREYEDALRSGADAATLALLASVQLAEAHQRLAQLTEDAIRRERELAEERRRAEQQLGLDYDALRIRLVAAGGFGTQQLEQEREMAQLIASGADQALITMLELVQATETAARAGDAAAARLRFRDEMTLRVTTALYGDEAAADFALYVRHLNEYNEAVRQGTDATMLAWLQEAQLAERRRFMADQVDVVIASTQRRVDDLRRTIDTLRDFGVQAGLETASPATRLMQARSTFLELAEIARAGDQGAAGRLPAIAQAFLDASRAYNASGLAFVSDVGLVQRTMEDLASMFESQVSVAEQQISLLQEIRDAMLHGPADQLALLQAGFNELKGQLEVLNEVGARTARAVEALAAA